MYTRDDSPPPRAEEIGETTRGKLGPPARQAGGLGGNPRGGRYLLLASMKPDSERLNFCIDAGCTYIMWPAS